VSAGALARARAQPPVPRAAPRVTLCVIHHRGAPRLRAALAAALAQPCALDEILIVDSASGDGSAAEAAAACPRARVLALPENRGPGAARNAGFAAAANDWILFQDNDVRLGGECLPWLLRALREQPQALAVAPRVLYEHDPELVQYESADWHFLGGMAPRSANRRAAELEPRPGPTTSLITACFLIDRARWTGAQPFDEDFEFNLEDHDFGARANLWGLSTWIEPRAQALHGAGTAGLSYRPGGGVAARRVFYLIRNRWLVIGKCYAARTLLLLAPVLLLYESVQLAGLLRKGWLRQWWLAVRSLASELPRLRAKRAAVQARRRRRDGLLLRPGPAPLTGALVTSRAERGLMAAVDLAANAYFAAVRAWL
jgi:GT2 family glycosyltransferase